MLLWKSLPPRAPAESEGCRGSGTPSTCEASPRSALDRSSSSKRYHSGRSSSGLSSQGSRSEDLSTHSGSQFLLRGDLPSRSRSNSRLQECALQTRRHTTRRESFRSLGAHVGWRTLLEFAGETKEAWVERKVHRWLGVSEGDAQALLGDLLELKRSLGEETREQPQGQQRDRQGWGFLGWLFGCSGDSETRAPPVEHKETVRYEFDKLETLGVLGYGGFGSVNLMRCHVTGQVLAMKSVSKGTLVAMQLQHTAEIERDVMRACSSPFILKLAASFNRGDWLHLLMEVAMGGDLYTTYTREQFFGSEEHARFYAACVLCAFEHLHERKIIYRDLKMENVVVDSRGYGKLCDFGTATFRFSGGYTLCGTPEYMAPETITGAVQSAGVDWWSLGILIYELVMASTPFTGEDPLEIFSQIKDGIDCIRLPWRSWSKLVQGLCRQEPGMRLPMMPGGIDNIKAHAWFAETYFSWPEFESRARPAPYVPKLSGPSDVRNFSPQDQEKPQPVDYEDLGDAWGMDFEETLGPARVS